ncbi:hypothetical protein [Mycoplasmopsis arginini]|uniref:hypothetical protein n=1 Tax=Mycoplasmopsis arginini TaxID=2094 RepID=UPI003D016FB0
MCKYKLELEKDENGQIMLTKKNVEIINFILSIDSNYKFSTQNFNYSNKVEF